MADDSAVRIQRFDPRDAPLIASWVRDAQEMAWLSPETPFPLTTQKVCAWGGSDRRQFIFVDPQTAVPIGYAELNDMPSHPNQQWIGHMLLDPSARGRSLGLACVRTLLHVAFEQFVSDYVILVVVPQNERAIRCYLRAGFVHAGDEWKRRPVTDEPYRLLRMTIDRARYQRLHTVGRVPQELTEPAVV